MIVHPQSGSAKGSCSCHSNPSASPGLGPDRARVFIGRGIDEASAARRSLRRLLDAFPDRAGDDRLARAWDLVDFLLVEADNCLLKLILALDPELPARDFEDAPFINLPARGVVADGTLCLAVPDPNRGLIPDRGKKDGCHAMQLQCVDLASVEIADGRAFVVDLDN